MAVRKVIVACMRNEALFLVEWLAHHFAVGFTHVVVYTNDCDDGTDTMLNAMARHIGVYHFDNPPPYKRGTIQKQALANAMALRRVKGAHWVLHIDADEYVNVTIGNRTIDDLIALHPGADAIALMWRHFGSAGRKTWDGGSIIESFTQCEDTFPDVSRDEVVGFKTLFNPQNFRRMGVHAPKLPEDGFVPRVVNAAGVAMPIDNITQRSGSGYRIGPEHLTWDNALLHHHHVKSDDLHILKHARGDANGRDNGKREIGSAYYNHANRNEVMSTSLVDLRPRVREWEQRLMAIPGVAQAHARAWEMFRNRR